VPWDAPDSVVQAAMALRLHKALVAQGGPDAAVVMDGMESIGLADWAALPLSWRKAKDRGAGFPSAYSLANQAHQGGSGELPDEDWLGRFRSLDLGLGSAPRSGPSRGPGLGGGGSRQTDPERPASAGPAVAVTSAMVARANEVMAEAGLSVNSVAGVLLDRPLPTVWDWGSHRQSPEEGHLESQWVISMFTRLEELSSAESPVIDDEARLAVPKDEEVSKQFQFWANSSRPPSGQAWWWLATRSGHTNSSLIPSMFVDEPLRVRDEPERVTHQERLELWNQLGRLQRNLGDLPINQKRLDEVPPLVWALVERMAFRADLILKTDSGLRHVESLLIDQLSDELNNRRGVGVSRRLELLRSGAAMVHVVYHRVNSKPLTEQKWKQLARTVADAMELADSEDPTVLSRFLPALDVPLWVWRLQPRSGLDPFGSLWAGYAAKTIKWTRGLFHFLGWDSIGIPGNIKVGWCHGTSR
jgi:hypothetical protein